MHRPDTGVLPTSTREDHHCHARGCTVLVQPEMLMCKTHWFSVPKPIRAAVLQSYRHGQCLDKNPSAQWHNAADAAIGYVALVENRPITVKQRAAMLPYGYGCLSVPTAPLGVSLMSIYAPRPPAVFAVPTPPVPPAVPSQDPAPGLFLHLPDLTPSSFLLELARLK